MRARPTLRGGTIRGVHTVCSTFGLRPLRPSRCTGHAPQHTGVARRASVGGGRITPIPPNSPLRRAQACLASHAGHPHLVLAAPNARPRAHAAVLPRQKPPVAACRRRALLAPSPHAPDDRRSAPWAPPHSRLARALAQRSASSMSSCSTKSLTRPVGRSAAVSINSSSMNCSSRSRSSKRVEPITMAMRAADSRLQRV